MHWSILLPFYGSTLPLPYKIKLTFINVQLELHTDVMYPKHMNCLYTEGLKCFHV